MFGGVGDDTYELSDTTVVRFGESTLRCMWTLETSFPLFRGCLSDYPLLEVMMCMQWSLRPIQIHCTWNGV